MSGQPFRKRLKYTAIYWALLTTIFLSRISPRRWWLGFFGWVGGIVFLFPSRYKDLVIAHLGLAYGGEKTRREILDLARQVYVMLGRNGAESLRSVTVTTRKAVDKIVTVTGLEHADRARAKGRGVVYFTGHCGAWELMIRIFALYGHPMLVIGTTLKDPRINELVLNIRKFQGSEPVERGKDMFRLIKNLKKGGGVAILIDQDTKVKSRMVNFYGMPAATPVGAALLAMKTGAAVIPATIHLGADWKQHLEIFPEVELVNTGDEEKDLVTNTQNFSDILEAAIRRHPAQWVWMHERWKTKPGEEER